jgi:hypothetical protein
MVVEGELPFLATQEVLVVEVLEQEQVVLEILHHSHQHKEQMVERDFLLFPVILAAAAEVLVETRKLRQLQQEQEMEDPEQHLLFPEHQ